MKLFQRLFLVCVLLSVVFVRCDCQPDPDEPQKDGIIQFLAKSADGKPSKTWIIKSLTEDGAPTTLDFSKAQMTFNYDGADGTAAKPTTFSYVTGGLPFNPVGATSGTWEINAAMTELTFKSGSTVVSVPVTGAPSASSLGFTFKYKKVPTKGPDITVVMTFQPK